MKLEMKPAKPSQGKARVGFEATAGEWRFHDELELELELIQPHMTKANAAG